MKTINDTHGHLAGDSALMAMASVLPASLPAHDGANDSATVSGKRGHPERLSRTRH